VASYKACSDNRILTFLCEQCFGAFFEQLTASLPTVCLYIMIVFHAVICAHYSLPHYDMCLLFDSVIMKGKVKGQVHPLAGS
jgi:hypothetical protein